MQEAFKGLYEIYSKLPLWMYLLVIAAIVIKIIENKRKKKKFQTNKNHIINDYKVGEPKRRQFEKEVANLFEQNGWEVVLGPGYDDGGKDIVVRRGLEIYLIQCKHYYGTWFVGPNQIRDFQGAIDLYEKKNNMTVRGIFITSGKTTSKAREAAKMLAIELWDKYNRREKINSL